MTEFCKPDFRVIWGNGEIVTAKTLGEIMPDSFDKTNL
jgi:cytidine deaminase